jgi:hypothetical protein
MSRFGVLGIVTEYINDTVEFVVYDSATGQIVDGVYRYIEDALDIARVCNETGRSEGSRPNSVALGLVFH